VRRRKAHAKYDAWTGDQYKINSVLFPQDSNMLSQQIRSTAGKTLLVVGKPFDLDVIKAERLRIDEHLKENGYYFFSPEFLLIRTDSTNGDHKVDMQLVVKPETPQQGMEVYRIKDVFIYSNYSLNTAQIDTLKSDAEFYRGYYVIDREKKFKPKLFTEAMKFNPGNVYNRTDHNLTLNRLINFNLFKFVKNRFEVNESTDSALLDAYYYLTPLPKKSLRGEITTITRSNNLNGSLISFTWRNRNTFRAGEQLSVSAYVGSDVQFSGALRGYNTYRSGAELNFNIPRFFLPGASRLRNRGGYVPRTNIQLGYDIINRRNLYTVNSFRFNYGYSWKESIQKQYEFNPIAITYAQPVNVTSVYDSLIRLDTLLARAVEEQLILGSNWEYNYNPLVSGQLRSNAYYLNALVDLSGNIAGLLSGADYKSGKQVSIAKVPFSQYIKFEIDGRYYRKLGLYSSWANRVIVGIGIPYGNSVQLPFIKQFFVGGNNSLRGFRSRSVGPGIYKNVRVTNFLPDETGDIKVEFNTEFRPRISGPLYGAIFFDAGNIWLVNDSNYTKKPGAQFSGKFLSQLAMDVGVGLRFDITLFIIRFDVGFPIRKPWEQNPWVMDQIRFSEKAWRRENIIYNVGIGYPF
jgi:outer membrane protein assembly factor BamA